MGLPRQGFRRLWLWRWFWPLPARARSRRQRRPPRGRSPRLRSCSSGRASALSEIACELASAYKDGPAAPLVIASPPTSDQTLQSPDRLSARIAQRGGRSARRRSSRQ